MLPRSLLVVGFALCASPAIAQEGAPTGPPQVDDQAKALAKRAARKGRKAFGKEQYDKAATKLLEAHSHWPLPHLLIEVAKAQAAVGGDAAIETAWATIRKAQADAYDDDTRQLTADAAAEMAAVFGESHGLLRVTSTPDKAKLVLTPPGEGAAKIEAETPFERWIPLGRWALAVSAEAHKEQASSVTLGPGGEPVELKILLVSLKSLEEAKAKKEAEKAAKAQAAAAAKAEDEARKRRVEAKRLAAIEARRQAAIDAERRMAYFVLGSGAAVVGGGVLVGMWAGQAEDDLNGLKGAPRRRAEIDAAYDKANASTRAANALLTVGVAVLAGGGWLLFTAGDGVTVAGSF